MTKVTVRYLQANGRYHEETGHTETQSPIFIVNHHDAQAHSLVHNPAYHVKEKRPWFLSWDEVLTAEPPPAEHYADRLMVVCEDQNPWPFSTTMLPDPIDRQLEFKEYNGQCLQKAVTMSSRDSERQGMRDAWSVASLMIFCIVSAVIVLIALQSKTVQGLADVAGAMWLAPFLMGGLRFKRKKRSGDGDPPAAPKRRRKPKRDDWEVVTIADEVALTQGGSPMWEMIMPLPLIMEYHPAVTLSQNARYTQELNTARLMGMAVFGFIALGMFLVATAAIPQITMLWSVVISVPLSMLGVLYGRFVGFKRWAPPPCWTVRRLFKRNEEGRILDVQGEVFHPDSMIPAATVIESQSHTMLTGMDYEYFAMRRRSVLQSTAEALSQQAASSGNSPIRVAQKVDPERLAEAYRPRQLTAAVLYEWIVGRDYKKKFKDRPEKLSRLEKYSRAGMALGALGLLVFVVFFLA